MTFNLPLYDHRDAVEVYCQVHALVRSSTLAAYTALVMRFVVRGDWHQDTEVTELLNGGDFVLWTHHVVAWTVPTAEIWPGGDRLDDLLDRFYAARR